MLYYLKNKKFIFLGFVSLISVLALFSFSKIRALSDCDWSGWVNGWQDEFTYECDVNKVITGVHSKHSNFYEDRRFDFKHCKLDSVKTTEGFWSGWVNDYDEEFTYICPENRIITGIHSKFDRPWGPFGKKNDRKFEFYCKKLENAQRANCFWTDWVNDYDKEFKFICPGNKVITGVHSKHSNHHEDRKFDFYCCDIQSTSPQPPSPPLNLSSVCSSSGNKVTLSWNPVSGATSYGIRVHDGTREITSKEITNTSYTQDIECNHTYTWWVHAINSAGWSDASYSSFNCPCSDQNLPSCNFNISPSTIKKGEKFFYSWSSQNCQRLHYKCTGVLGDYFEMIGVGREGDQICNFDGTWSREMNFTGEGTCTLTVYDKNNNSASCSASLKVVSQENKPSLSCISNTCSNNIVSLKWRANSCGKNIDGFELDIKENNNPWQVLLTGPTNQNCYSDCHCPVNSSCYNDFKNNYFPSQGQLAYIYWTEGDEIIFWFKYGGKENTSYKFKGKIKTEYGWSGWAECEECKCEVSKCINCSDCGKGIFNACDRQECLSCQENCYFIDKTIGGDCLSCSSANSCQDYQNDKTTCQTDPCGFGNCKWENNKCVSVSQLQTCSDGTPYGQCSPTKPKYCDNGNLVDRCDICGCPSGYSCQENGKCYKSSKATFVIVPSYIEIEEGEVKKLKAFYDPDGPDGPAPEQEVSYKTSWTSLNPNVVTVFYSREIIGKTPPSIKVKAKYKGIKGISKGKTFIKALYSPLEIPLQFIPPAATATVVVKGKDFSLINWSEVASWSWDNEKRGCSDVAEGWRWNSEPSIPTPRYTTPPVCSRNYGIIDKGKVGSGLAIDGYHPGYWEYTFSSPLSSNVYKISFDTTGALDKYKTLGGFAFIFIEDSQGNRKLIWSECLASKEGSLWKHRDIIYKGEIKKILFQAAAARCKLEGDYYYANGEFVRLDNLKIFQKVSSRSTCSDGTPYGQCSPTKPKYCDNGNLVDRCDICGCPSGYSCQEDGSCVSLPVPTQCLGDINNDRRVDIYDLAILIAHWGQENTADLNNDNTVNLEDLRILLTHWGEICENQCQVQGDVDNNGEINCDDLDCVLGVVLGEKSIKECPCSDVNKDGKINQLDVSKEIDILLSKGIECGKCKQCSDCGKGLFNICDRQECLSCQENCYFIDKTIGGDCLSCSSANSCQDYQNDKTTCQTDPCGFGNCKWENNKCVSVSQLQTCSDGTPYGQCSPTKPKYCDNGNLVDRCDICGCPSGYSCQDDGSCEGNLNTCIAQGGEICEKYLEVCSGTWITASDTTRCCKGSCISKVGESTLFYVTIKGHGKVEGDVLCESSGLHELCKGSVIVGHPITLTAVETDSNYQFEKWSVCTSCVGPCLVPSDHPVAPCHNSTIKKCIIPSAPFASDPYRMGYGITACFKPKYSNYKKVSIFLGMSRGEEGIRRGGKIIVSPSGICNTIDASHLSCGTHVPYNTQITLTAYANPGYVFDGWSGWADSKGNLKPGFHSNCGEKGGSIGVCTITVQGDINVGGSFRRIK